MKKIGLVAVLALAQLALQPAPPAGAALPRVTVTGSRSTTVARALSRSGRVEVVEGTRDLRRPVGRRRRRWTAAVRALDLDWVVQLQKTRRRRRTRLQVRVRDRQGRTVFFRSLRLRRATSRVVAGWLLPRVTLRRSALNAREERLIAPRWATGSDRPSSPTASKPGPPMKQPDATVTEHKAPVVAAMPIPTQARTEPEEADPFAEEPSASASAPMAVQGSTSTQAATEVPSSGDDVGGVLSKRWRLPFKLAGDIWAHHISYLLDREDHLVNSRNEVAIRLVPSARLGTAGKFVRALVDGRARVDQSDSDRTEAFFTEAYVEAGWGPLSLALGKRLLRWGATDRFSPVDNLRQIDYRDPLDPEKRGVYLVQMRMLLGPRLFLEGAWIPFFNPDMQPGPNGLDERGMLTSSSRWFVPPELPVIMEPPETIEDGPGWFQYAARAGLCLEQLDLALSYNYGFIPLPYLVFEPPGTLRPNYHRRHAIGLDLQTVLGRLAVKGEAALSLTRDIEGDDPEVPDAYVTYVLQLEYRLARIADTNNSLRLTGQFYGDHDLRGEELPADLLHPFRFLGVLSVRWEYLDHTAVEVTGLHEIPDGALVRLRAWHELVDGLRVELGGELLAGAEDAFFGRFNNNHRLYARLKYSF